MLCGKRINGSQALKMLEKLSEIFDKQLGYIMGTSDVPLAADLTNEDICQLGEWAIQEQYEDSFRKYITLDEYGENAVERNYSFGICTLPGTRRTEKHKRNFCCCENKGCEVNI